MQQASVRRLQGPDGEPGSQTAPRLSGAASTFAPTPADKLESQTDKGSAPPFLRCLCCCCGIVSALCGGEIHAVITAAGKPNASWNTTAKISSYYVGTSLISDRDKIYGATFNPC